MKILYKYCSMAGIKILENKTIKVTPPNEFNDPFEFASFGKGKISEDHIRQLVTDDTLLNERFALQSDPDIDIDDFRRSQHALLTDRARLNTTIDETTSLYQNWAETFVDQVSRNGGVVCLTEDHNSILMWSHYASNHEGFMVGFDVDRLPYLKLFPVDYTHSKPLSLDLQCIHQPDYLEQQFIEIMKRKSPVWAYEKEYRMQFHFSLCQFISAISMWFFHFDPSVIRTVHLGIKCKPEDRDKIRDILAIPDFQHVELYQAIKETGRFKVQYERIA